MEPTLFGKIQLYSVKMALTHGNQINSFTNSLHPIRLKSYMVCITKISAYSTVLIRSWCGVVVTRWTRST